MSSSREKAWRNSDGFKERETIQDRMKKMNLKPILPWTKEGKKTREEFVKIHEENQLQTFKEEIERNTDLTLPSVPERGGFKISRVLKSDYLFS